MAGYVTRIGPDESLDPAGIFAGQWRRFERRTLPAASETHFTADHDEFAIIILTGTGEVETNGITRPVTAGSAITIGRDATVRLTSSQGPLDLFITTLRLD